MGLFDRFLGRQKSFNLQALSKIISGGAWNNNTLIQQYSKSLYVFAAINKIATKISGIDLKLFEIINSKGELKEYPSHEILDLLYRPNPFQTVVFPFLVWLILNLLNCSLVIIVI